MRAFGPVEQGLFLNAMGMPERLLALIQNDSVSEEAAAAMVASYKRLVDPAQMGERFKVCSPQVHDYFPRMQGDWNRCLLLFLLS